MVVIRMDLSGFEMTHIFPFSSSPLLQGHISVAEIYLTDLCEAEDAASVCKYHLDKAIESKPSSPEAHQLLASWCISMMDDEEEGDDKFDEAKKAIQTAVALWLPQYQVGKSFCHSNFYTMQVILKFSGLS